ncbi:thioredoxin fold domain-containing protein [Ideonella sp. YS5]|uniref:thioredoxin fold domain-containing protein n=1 Tax=Ideonella sp. YS5 TaxID=3453714 RepID=UPI003EEDE5B6
MQRRRFNLTALASLAVLGPLAGCGRQAETPVATMTPAAASATAPTTEVAAPASATASAAGQNIYTLAASASGFSIGPMMSAHTVYVFFDPTCPHCAHLWANAQSVTKQLKLVWIPIGFLRPQSQPMAATILAARDPVAAMTENETSVASQGKGITPASPLDEAAVAKVKANTELFNKFNADSVPLIVYRNGKTGEVGQHSGAVEGAQLLAFAGL